MFAYCLNNPINRADAEGCISYDCKDEDANNDDDPINDVARMGNSGNPGQSQQPLSGGNGSAPNPDGRHGGAAHRGIVNMLRSFFDRLGYNTSTQESRVYYGDAGKYRYPDLIVSSDEGVEYYIQVGRQTTSGLPIAREQRAIDNLLETGIDVWFVPYN